MFWRSAAGLSVVIILLSLLVLGGAVADTTSTYSVEAEQSVDTPSRTVTIESSEYTITSVGEIKEGDRLNVQVTVPAEKEFTVYLYNTNRQIETGANGEENGTYTLNTTSLTPGTYILALDVDGVFQDIQPVVVSGHEFTVNAPENVPKGESISVTASVTNDPQQVDVVIFNESWEHTATAARIGDGEYNAVIDERLAPGEYSLYVGTRGTETLNGNRVLNGISSAHTVTIEGDTTPTTTSPTTTTETTSTQSSTSTTPPTDTTTISDGSSTTSTTTIRGTTTAKSPTTQTSTITSTTTAVANETTDSVITPNTPSQNTTNTETNVPGFTLSTAAVAFVSLFALLWRQT